MAKTTLNLDNITFKKGNIEKAAGFQASVWDKFKDEFPNPGDFLEFPHGAGGLTSQQASNLAKRLMVLHPDLFFHSTVNKTVTPHTVIVRRREEGWFPSTSEEEEEQEEQTEFDASVITDQMIDGKE